MTIKKLANWNLGDEVIIRITNSCGVFKTPTETETKKNYLL